MDPVLTALQGRDSRRVAKALAGRSEAERRRLAPAVLGRRETDAAVAVAILGTASLGQIRRRGAWEMATAPDDEPPRSCSIAGRRGWPRSPPGTCAPSSGSPVLPLVRALVRAGAIERPEAGLYLDGLLAASREYDWSAKRLLREDSALVDDAWDLIALGGGTRDTLTAADAAGAQLGRRARRRPAPCPSAGCAAVRAGRRPRRLPHVVVHEALALAAGE